MIARASLLLLGLLAGCAHDHDHDHDAGAAHAVHDASLPEVRYYLIADT